MQMTQSSNSGAFLNSMRKFSLISAAALILPMAAFAQTGTSAVVAPTASSAKSILSAQDRSFANTAAAAGLAEVQDGQLAISKGNSTVKKLGSQMVDDHTKANHELASLASSDGLVLPDSMTPSDTATHAKLEGLSGASFDSTYLKGQHLAHEQAIKLFETEASAGSDPGLKTFATNTLPTLKMHLKMIKAAQQERETATSG
jgi:putative membrane protein